MTHDTQKSFRDRVQERVREWSLVVERPLETETSLVAFGRRGDQPVVMKVLRGPDDEWLSGQVPDAFDGNGTVQIYEYVEGAVLLERLDPGTSPLSTVLDGRDHQANDILAGSGRHFKETMTGPIEAVLRLRSPADSAQDRHIHLQGIAANTAKQQRGGR